MTGQTELSEREKWIDVEDYVTEVLENEMVGPAIEGWEMKTDGPQWRLEVVTGDGDVWVMGPGEAVAFCGGLDLGRHT